MKFLVALSCVLAVAVAKPGVIAPLAYASQPLLAANGFSYATASGPLAYSTQTVSYSAPTVAYTAPAVAYAAPAVAYSAPVVTAPAQLVAASTPLVATSAPVVAAAPVVVKSVATPVLAAVDKTQYHAQDVLGQASYGHAEAFQQHDAIQDAAGNKVGSYSYVAPDGQVIAANYVADALGYRVATNAAPVAPTELPVAPSKTVEVVEARAAHQKAHEEAKSRSRRGIVTYNAVPLAYSAPIAYTHASPLVYTATRAASLTTVVNNPGHAVSYRID